MPARLAAAVFGGWMALLALLFAVGPAGAGWLLPLLAGASAIIAVHAGVRRHGPPYRRPWNLLGLAIAGAASGTALLRAPGWATGRVPGLAPVDSVLVVAAYLALAGVLVIFLRGRTGGARDRAGLLDALTLTAGVALLVWTFRLAPRLHTEPHGLGWFTVA